MEKNKSCIILTEPELPLAYVSKPLLEPYLLASEKTPTIRSIFSKKIIKNLGQYIQDRAGEVGADLAVIDQPHLTRSGLIKEVFYNFSLYNTMPRTV